MTEEDDQNPGEDVESTDGENETLQEATLEEMQEFVEALNLFVHRVASMDWPEAFNLTENEKFCFSVFRSYWRHHRRRHRKNEEHDHRVHMRFHGVDEDEIRRFMRRRFGGMFEEEDPTLNIDPGHHEPDHEHTDTDARERQQRFRDEWS